MIYIDIKTHQIVLKIFTQPGEEILPFAATWMDHEDIMLSEIKRQRKTVYNTFYMWNLKISKFKSRK